jgi:mercuric ion binding protein
MTFSKYITLGLSLVFALMLNTSFAQSETQAQDDKWTTVELKVSGVCGMCKTRIENALDIKGVKFSDWTQETQMCKIVYRTGKVSEEDLQKALTAVGHDTEAMKATDQAYGDIHGCCKYRSDVSH